MLITGIIHSLGVCPAPEPAALTPRRPSNTKFRALAAVGAVAGIALIPATADAQSYDLRFDWSNTLNPGPTWMYREGVRQMPPIANWDPLPSTNWATPQGGWAVGPSATGGGVGGGGTPFWQEQRQ